MAIDLRPWATNKKTYLVWRPENDDTEEDAQEVLSTDAESAAEDWAEYSDCESADYTIVRGSEATVCVREQEGGEVLTFVVSGETVPQYTAKEVVP